MLTLVAVGLLAGLITGVSPCVLPVLPVILFAGADSRQPLEAPGAGSAAPAVADVGATRWWTRPAATIAGLVLSFTALTLVGSLALSALGLPDALWRWAGMVVLLVVGLSLIVPRLDEVIQRPFARFARASRFGNGSSGFVLGLGLGALYVPCAGPVLAAVAIAGASGRIDARIVALTLAFAVGAAVPLFFFAAAGSAIGRRLAGYRRRARVFRVIGGTVMIALAAALTFGLTDALQRTVPDYTAGVQVLIEDNPAARQALAELDPAPRVSLDDCPAGRPTPADCGPAPQIAGISRWFNTDGGRALRLPDLRGKVAIVDFWTYSCINCQRALPHVQAWYSAYRAAGLEVIGVHTPEFAFEKDPDSVAQAISDQGIDFPVAMDNAGATWTNFHNRYWPALYLIDARGIVRHVSFGEGGYAATESLVRQLLIAADPAVRLPAPVEG